MTLHAVAGPDRIVANRTVVGFDGTRSSGGTAADPLAYRWQLIQVPEGDPHLTHYQNLDVLPDDARVLVPVAPPAHVEAAAGDTHISVMDSVGAPVDLSGAGVTAGDLLIVTAGPNAGRYVVSSNPYGVGNEELDLDRPMASTGNIAAVDFDFWSVTSHTVILGLPAPASMPVSGDILIVDGYPVTVSVFGPPPLVTIEEGLPLAGLSFDHGVAIGEAMVSNSSAPYASFVPSVQGLHVMRLFVQPSMSLPGWSEPDVAVISVLAANTALGLPVDSSWLWRALSDFWGGVKDKGWMEDAWRTVIRTYGSMLQELWNVELSVSLASAQDVAMARWLPVSPRLVEPEPEKCGLFKRFRKVYSDALVGGGMVNLVLHRSPTAETFVFNDAWNLLPSQLEAWATAAGITGLSAIIESITVGGVTTQHFAFRSVNYAITVTGDCFSGVYTNSLSGGGRALDASTFALYRLAAGPVAADYSAAVYDYDAVIKAGDPINIGGTAHTVAGVGVSSENGYPYTRVMLVEPTTLVAGDMAQFCLPSYFRSESVDYRYELATPGDAALLTVDDGTTRVVVTASVTATSAYCLGIDHPALWYDGRTVVPEGVLRLFYLPVEDTWLSIPRLQEHPDAAKGWVEYSEYVLANRFGRRAVVFDFLTESQPDRWPSLYRAATSPALPEQLFAEVVYIDQRPDLSTRFGKGFGMTLENSPTRPGFSYQKALLGLWYCYLHGSKPRYIERGLSICLGAPFFEEAGTILEIQHLDTERGYVLVRDKADVDVVRGYIYSLRLGLDVNPATGVPYVTGDTVSQFETVCNSVTHRDYKNHPEFVRGMIAAGVITEVEKYHRFFLGADVDTLDPSDVQAISAAATFLEQFRTTYNDYLFALVKHLETVVGLTDEVSFKYTLSIDTSLLARWGVPRFDRVQLSGAMHDWHTPPATPTSDHDFHNRWGVTICSQEHYTAAVVSTSGGAAVVEIRHVFKDGTHGTRINPRLYGIRVGDLVVLSSTGLDDVVSAVTNTDVTLTNVYGGAVEPDPGYDYFEFAVFGQRVWWGFDQFCPRSYVRIRTGVDIVHGVVTTDDVVADHYGPELDPDNPNWPEDPPWTPWP